MQTGLESSLAPNRRVRAPLVVGILAATFTVGLSTGILLSRVSSGAGHTSVTIVAPPRTTTMIDAWRLGVPAVVAAPAQPNRTVSSWLDIPAGVTVPAVSNRMIDAWRLGDPALVVAPAQPNRMIDAWRLAAR